MKSSLMNNLKKDLNDMKEEAKNLFTVKKTIVSSILPAILTYYDITQYMNDQVGTVEFLARISEYLILVFFTVYFLQIMHISGLEFVRFVKEKTSKK